MIHVSYRMAVSGYFSYREQRVSSQPKCRQNIPVFSIQYVTKNSKLSIKLLLRQGIKQNSWLDAIHSTKNPFILNFKMKHIFRKLHVVNASYSLPKKNCLWMGISTVIKIISIWYMYNERGFSPTINAVSCHENWYGSSMKSEMKPYHK